MREFRVGDRVLVGKNEIPGRVLSAPIPVEPEWIEIRLDGVNWGEGIGHAFKLSDVKLAPPAPFVLQNGDVIEQKGFEGDSLWCIRTPGVTPGQANAKRVWRENEKGDLMLVWTREGGAR